MVTVTTGTAGFITVLKPKKAAISTHNSSAVYQLYWTLKDITENRTV